MVLATELTPGCSSPYTYRYDVYVSFRAPNTRYNSFINFLYCTLYNAGINTFLDHQGDEDSLKPELETAIESTKVFIVVLSANYASSPCCLDELVLILEQKRLYNQLVIPIFYHVHPNDIRKQRGRFGEAMGVAMQQLSSELLHKVDVWNKALRLVAVLRGIHVTNNAIEEALIRDVVTCVRRTLDEPPSRSLPVMIGMDPYVETIRSWLTDGAFCFADFLTIVGMSRTGKTLLARYIFQLLSNKFYGGSFIEGIDKRCKEHVNGLLDVQKELYRDITGTTKLPSVDVFGYTCKLEKALARKRVFIVLDDIASPQQLDALLGRKGLYPRCKIIVTTTQDPSLTERCALFKSQVLRKHKHLSLYRH